MILIENKYVNIKFFKSEKLFRIEIKESVNQIQKFKDQLLIFIDFAKIYKPVKALWNLKKFNITIDSSLQKWIDNEINKKELEIGIIKESFVFPDEMLTSLTVEQTMAENFGKKIKSHFFSNEEDALKWLLENETR